MINFTFLLEIFNWNLVSGIIERVNKVLAIEFKWKPIEKFSYD